MNLTQQSNKFGDYTVKFPLRSGRKSKQSEKKKKMAMIVRQLLNNRSNPCRRLCRALIPCYFKQTQTLISTQSSPFSPPQTSSETPPFKTRSQHRRALYSPGGILSLFVLCGFGLVLFLFTLFFCFIKNSV